MPARKDEAQAFVRRVRVEPPPLSGLPNAPVDLLIVRFRGPLVECERLVDGRLIRWDVPVALAQGRAVVLRQIARRNPRAVLMPLDRDDEMSQDALERIVAVLERFPTADLVYGDHEVRGADGTTRVVYKPAFSPELLFSTNYLLRGWMVHAHLVAQLPDSAVLEAGEHALLLHVGRLARRIVHVPASLVVRGSASVDPEQPSALQRAIEAWIDTRVSSLTLTPSADDAANWRVDLRPVDKPLVSIIVPFRDKVELLRTCVEGVLDATDYDRIELLLVDNRSKEAQTSEYLASIEHDSRVRVLRDRQAKFNYSAVNNRAAQHATGELVLLLNNDIEIVDPHWLSAMVGYALQPAIGVVGARLLYPGGAVQHTGVVLGIGGYASHPFAGCEPSVAVDYGSPNIQRNVLAVTGACALLRRGLFEQIGGLDESFVLCGSDVALGLRSYELGYRNVVLPHATLVHHESLTRGTRVPAGDFRRSREVYAPWLEGRDPYYHPALTLLDDSGQQRQVAEGHRIPQFRWSEAPATGVPGPVVR